MTTASGGCVVYKENLSVAFGDSSPSRGAFGKEVLLFVDCQSLSYKERWHCEAMTERLDEHNFGFV